jgi:hypothetical protein
MAPNSSHRIFLTFVQKDLWPNLIEILLQRAFFHILKIHMYIFFKHLTYNI